MIRTTLLSLAMLIAGAAAQAQCRQALALGFDVSGSVDEREYRLQLDGLATALSDAEVRQTFLAAPQIPVRLMMYEWSGPQDQRIVIPWTTIENAEDLDRIIASLRSAPLTRERDNNTAISAAMLFGAQELDRQSECWQKTLDISGDGPANIGAHPQTVTEDFLGGITVNGLVIVPNSRANISKNRTNAKTLLTYYTTYVIRGPAAFVETAEDHTVFAEAMKRKLIRELQLPNLSSLRQAAQGQVQ